MIRLSDRLPPAVGERLVAVRLGPDPARWAAVEARLLRRALDARDAQVRVRAAERATRLLTRPASAWPAQRVAWDA
jgi:hypothetical protein